VVCMCDVCGVCLLCVCGVYVVCVCVVCACVFVCVCVIMVNGEISETYPNVTLHFSNKQISS
jgi:hypothetical protein